MLDSDFMNPFTFPLTQVLTLLLFNKGFNNYQVACVYDSADDEKLKSPELIKDFYEIYAANSELLKPLI